MLTGLMKGGGVVGEKLTMADKRGGGGGVGEMLTMADKGERRVWTPPFLADITKLLEKLVKLDGVGFVHITSSTD